MEQKMALTDKIVALLIGKLEQETDPERAQKWLEMLERVVAGQIRRFDEEKATPTPNLQSPVPSPQSPVPDKGR